MGTLTEIRPRSYQLRPGRFLLPSAIVIGFVLLLLYPPRLAHYIFEFYSSGSTLLQSHWDALDAGLRRCAELTAPSPVYSFPVPADRSNPRWNPRSGQNKTVVLRNATLFDGDVILPEPVDIVFEKGVVRSIISSSTGSRDYAISDADISVVDLDGQFVTPGLVDMHSHHLVGAWPDLKGYDDTNEVNAATGPLTPFVRALDSIKPYDIATTIIASGGVTSSLVLPGSANIMGGEAVIVKNLLRSGESGEETVEELLLEHGIPKEHRRRYMKMACGENPRRVYHHTRMGNAWIFRHHLARAKDLRDRQDAWCASAAAARRSGDSATAAALLAAGPDGKGGLPEELELDSTVAILRGKIGVNIHCYEQEDFEDMLLHSEEFGFRIQAFHHALSAWKVPELIKRSGQNITIATFADFSLYKKEGYDANLRAGKILAEHGVPVAYKSDHYEVNTNAKYLLSQAATAHAFGLPEIQALKSVTSVPATALDVHHRIGFVKPGYDADVVVWDSHPLSVGATPLQVYIDGKATLAEGLLKSKNVSVRRQEKPKMRAETPATDIREFCSRSPRGSENIVITGISNSYLQSPHIKASSGDNLTMVIRSGKITCLGGHNECMSSMSDADAHVIALQNGYVLPGLTAISTSLGLTEISSEDSTSDGTANPDADPLDPDNAIYAKYGVHTEGRAFERARIGGVTRAITAPVGRSFLGGISVGIKTSEGSNPLNGGIFKDDVALHFVVGQDAKGSTTPTVSSSIAKLRKILSDNRGKDTIFGKAADGKIAVVVHAENKYDILQLIKVKNDYVKVKLVIFGGAEAPAVADELAASGIPLIFTAAHSAPTAWERKDVLVGRPLTQSPVQVLAEANVTFALALPYETDWHLQNLALEASWAAKDAGLSPQHAVDLVSGKIDEILGLSTGSSSSSDYVIYEGNPLEYGANVVMAIDGDDGRVVSCWPEAE
ncbi:hypothetical protein VTN77DRAFT_4050 [Rasamsonia byssochlamydoides]|uniref:uncharacterized protein n=1 Tax=Rasamsonia byssochlamydoides TaxID=89139 RepID=UPI0037438D3C